MRILLTGYHCTPYRGSEPGFTWNWAWHLSQQHEVWVLTCGEFQADVQDFLSKHPNPNLHFRWTDPPRIIDSSRWPEPFRSLIPHYLVWQRKALSAAIKLSAEQEFDIVHHVSWGTVGVAPALWQLPMPFVWGPVGGGQTTPPSLLRYFGVAQLRERGRALRVAGAHLRPGIRAAATRSALVLSTNRETTKVLQRAGARDVELFLDSGIPPAWVKPHLPERPSRVPKFLWVGRLLRRKALPLALEAVARIPDVPLELLIAGDGERRQECERKARKLGITDRVRFLGNVPYDRMPELYRDSDAFLFTSIRDSFGMQVLEAASQGLPLIALDHQGVAAFIPDSACIKAPVGTPEETAQHLADAIRLLATSPELRRKMGEAGWAFARNETWDAKVKRITAMYETVIHERRHRVFAVAQG